MKKAIVISIIMMLLPAVAALAAMKIEITPSKTTFSENDYLSFSYKITSEIDQKITFIPEIRCSGNMPSSFFETKTITVGPGNPYTATFHGIKVEENTDSQQCVARVTIKGPNNVKFEKTFQIITKPSIDLVLNACSDSECKTPKRSFIKDSNVYLSATSKAVPTISASVVFPDQTKQAVTIPGSFAASQPGKYEIEISASKDGYKKYFSVSEISVIAAPYTIPYANFSSKAGQAVQRPASEQTGKSVPIETPQGAGKSSGCDLLLP